MTIHFSANFFKSDNTFHGEVETKKGFHVSFIPEHKEAIIQKCREVFEDKCTLWHKDPNDVIALEIYYYTDKENTIYKWNKNN